MRGQRAIWLVGMMGAGKSTVGRELAHAVARPFCDTDVVISQRAGRSIPEIFEQDGEPRFRALEREVIDAAGDDGAVVALGGGAMAQPGMPERLLARGTVVYLRARAETLLERIGDPRSRPLLAGLSAREREARLVALLGEREASYAQAHEVVDVDALDAQAVVREIMGALAERERQDGRG